MVAEVEMMYFIYSLLAAEPHPQKHQTSGSFWWLAQVRQESRSVRCVLGNFERGVSGASESFSPKTWNILCKFYTETSVLAEGQGVSDPLGGTQQVPQKNIQKSQATWIFGNSQTILRP